MSFKTALVTGASGFIARQTLLPLVELGYKVHGVTRNDGLDVPRVQWHACDLLNPTEIDRLLEELRPSHLLHMAWYTEHGKFWTAPENTAWLAASTYLFERFVSYGGQRILGVGTCAEYDWQREDKVAWKETDPCHPHTLYGKAKLTLYKRLEALPVSSAWARIFMLFGAHERPERLVPYTIERALAGEPILCTEGTQVRDFIDTRLCGRALAQLLDSNVAGPVNIGSGETTTIAELVKLICEVCAYKQNIQFGAIPMNKNDPPYIVPDLSRLRNEVRFTERQDTRQALTELVAERRKP